MLAVAYVEEAAALRQAGIQVPIVVMAGFSTAQVPAVERIDLDAGRQPATLRSSSRGAVAVEPPEVVHLKVDTGMTRLGFGRRADAAAACGRPGRIDGPRGADASSRADEDAECHGADSSTVFDETVAALATRGIRPRFVHAANSAGLAVPRPTHTLVRPGFFCTASGRGRSRPTSRSRP